MLQISIASYTVVFFIFCLLVLSYLQRDLSEPREERAVHRAGVARNVSDEDEG